MAGDANITADPAPVERSMLDYTEVSWTMIKPRALAVDQERQIFRTRAEAEAYLTGVLRGLTADRVQAVDTEICVSLSAVDPYRNRTVLFSVPTAPVHDIAEAVARWVNL